MPVTPCTRRPILCSCAAAASEFQLSYNWRLLPATASTPAQLMDSPRTRHKRNIRGKRSGLPSEFKDNLAAAWCAMFPVCFCFDLVSFYFFFFAAALVVLRFIDSSSKTNCCLDAARAAILQKNTEHLNTHRTEKRHILVILSAHVGVITDGHSWCAYPQTLPLFCWAGALDR